MAVDQAVGKNTTIAVCLDFLMTRVLLTTISLIMIIAINDSTICLKYAINMLSKLLDSEVSIVPSEQLVTLCI